VYYVRIFEHTQFEVRHLTIFSRQIRRREKEEAHKRRGHYGIHHTVIRCNKCFQTFEKKTEKNKHQKDCGINAPPPFVEVIDCDKTDELDEVLTIFRTWKLETEEDEEMKNWIMKYQVEFVRSNMPNDHSHDSRELAKWYLMWRVLFPTLETPVPNPCESINLKFHRCGIDSTKFKVHPYCLEIRILRDI
jgi:hypothetical protein